MTWRPLSAHGGQVTDVKFDSDGRIVVRSLQDVDAILDMNKEVRNHGAPGRYAGDSLGRHIASVPAVILHKWMQEGGVGVLDGTDQAFLARKMNDPDYAYLRTSGGRIGVSNGVAR